MKNAILAAVLSTGMLVGPTTASAAVYRTKHHVYHSRAAYVRHKRHMKTAKRVGVGAVGGAAVGALAGGGKGAGIGALAGAGAGALFDRHEKHHGHY